MTAGYCIHDDDPYACPVAACNPRGARDPYDGPRPVLRVLTARHGGVCAHDDCTDLIEPGDAIVWRPADGLAAHTACRNALEEAA